LVQLHTAETADMTRLVRTTMRLRPDRIIIGEVRGGEALVLLKAWNTGHPGGVTTIHANSAMAALTATFQLGAGSWRATAARVDRRDHQPDRFHRAHLGRGGA
jgi:Flp pilus assembly CpaF family ATPase